MHFVVEPGQATRWICSRLFQVYALIYPKVCFRLRFVFQIILHIIPEISINLLNMILFKSNMLFINFGFNKERI